MKKTGEELIDYAIDVERERQKIDDIIPKKILELIEDLGISQRELARRLGKSGGTITHWLLKRATPTARDLYVMSEVLQIDINYFFEEDTTPYDAKRYIKDKREKEAVRFFRDLLFKDSMPTDFDVALLQEKITLVPEDTVPYLLKLIKVIKRGRF